LVAATRAPVHAYLLVGPPGSGRRAAARGLAAALLCPRGGCGNCAVCRRVRAEAHPDLVVVERAGPFISVGQAREIQRLAMRTPNEADRKVLVLTDFHLVREAAGTLLKVVEEPPPSTVFVILSEHVPRELLTIASRCLRIDFSPVPAADVADWLVATGVARPLADEVAEAAGGRLDRALLLASDPGFSARREAWASVPRRLDGTGAAAAALAAELSTLLDQAVEGPLQARQAAEAAEVDERGRRGDRGAGRREMVERHRRELRRLRTDELRFGLAALQHAYRDALVAGSHPRECVDAIAAVHAAVEALASNPNETLLLQALLVRLPGLGGGPG
ncbi:MAG: hypothetical protein LC792_06170, partial [Actinobacteria bacterium]|nr:hypothetical protein [Actinomycetota bacterium]